MHGRIGASGVDFSAAMGVYTSYTKIGGGLGKRLSARVATCWNG